MRIGLVCPYTWEVPGGVREHVSGLAEALMDLGHEVSVIAPADDDADLPPYVVPAGRAVPVPYNGSVARLAFGFLSASRVRRWLKDGDFDEVRTVDEADARAMAQRLAKEEGIFAGTSSGLNVVAALRLAQELGRGSTVATVAVDTGFKYLAGDLYRDKSG